MQLLHPILRFPVYWNSAAIVTHGNLGSCFAASGNGNATTAAVFIFYPNP
ncbi:MAG: hypothetical protein H7199_03025 [Burkholderiales bacterium]|nr:hypothetical protein [Flavobacterium sp.]